jgi:hypothetical protein
VPRSANRSRRDAILCRLGARLPDARLAPLTLLFVAVSLLIAACGLGVPTGNDGDGKHRASTKGATSTQDSAADAEDPLAQAARKYAKEHDITCEEALRQLRLQERQADEVSHLEAQLRRNEADTYAGLWIQHEPTYRYTRKATEALKEHRKRQLEERIERGALWQEQGRERLAQIHASAGRPDDLYGACHLLALNYHWRYDG